MKLAEIVLNRRTRQDDPSLNPQTGQGGIGVAVRVLESVTLITEHQADLNVFELVDIET